MGLVLILIGVGLFERLVVDLGPNVELVTAASVVAGMYVRGWGRWLVPVVIMAVSDSVLGWGPISVFTWSGFLLMVGLPRVWQRLSGKKVMVATMSGVSGVVGFYLWTNLGVWLTDAWGMYPDTWNGLMQAYINGLPFLRMQLVSALWYVPLLSVVVEKGVGWWGQKGRWELVGERKKEWL